MEPSQMIARRSAILKETLSRIWVDCFQKCIYGIKKYQLFQIRKILMVFNLSSIFNWYNELQNLLKQDSKRKRFI